MTSTEQGESSAKARADNAVIATNDDAFLCKLSATRCGYYEDEFLEAIVRELPRTDTTPLRRPPIINRGTFARVEVVRQLVDSFVSDCCALGIRAQIISFGAGYDTLPFRIFDTNTHPTGITYVELDFHTVTKTKAQLISFVKRISTLFDTVDRFANETGLLASTNSNSNHYALHECDLRNIDSVRDAFSVCHVDYAVPTLFLTECVLMYLRPTDSDALLSFVASTFTAPHQFINYEPIRPFDAFGSQMVSNIAKRGSPLLGITDYPDEKTQRGRFRKHGWDHVHAVNMRVAFDAMFTFADKMKLNRHQVLDELEEWNMIMEHYVIVCARSSQKLTLHNMFSSK